MLVVCTCVVHKRCHKDVVNQCPGEKQDPQDVISNEGKVLTWMSLYLIMLQINSRCPSFHCVMFRNDNTVICLNDDN